MGISFNSADYYRKVADCAGCVQNVSEALVGLTGGMYKKWYFERCSFTYSMPYALLYKNALKIYRFGRVKKYINCDHPADFYDRKDKSFGRYFPLLFAKKDAPQNKVGFLRKWVLRQPTKSPAKMTTSLIMKIINDNKMFWPLLPPRPRRIPARLYHARRMKSAKQNVLFFEQLETQMLDEQLENGYQRAPDKRLYLAGQLKDLAEELAINIPRFGDVLANENLLKSSSLRDPKRRFDPLLNPQDRSPQVGRTIAGICFFPKLLTRFEEEIGAPVSTSPPPAPATVGPFESLLLNYTEEKLKKLLQELGLIDELHRATPVASSGAWVGVIYALRKSKPPRIKDNSRASQKAFHDLFGAKVSERAIQGGILKLGNEADQFKEKAMALLH